MYVVNLRLENKHGQILWKASAELNSQNQLSVGRSHVCDVVCPFFSSSEWALLTTQDGFTELSGSDGHTFGTTSVRMCLRRHRTLFADVCANNEPLFSLSQPIDFSLNTILAKCSSVVTFLNPRFRTVAREILSLEQCFDEQGQPNAQIAPDFIVDQLNQRLNLVIDQRAAGPERLNQFSQCFWMIASYVYAEGPLTHWVRSDDVQEILLNGFDDCWLETDEGFLKQSSPFESWNDLWAWLSKYSAAAGRELVTMRGCCDFQLPCGARVHVALSPLSRREGYVSIRCHRDKGLSLDEMRERGVISEAQKHMLERLVIERRNLLVVGATSSGKTTLLRALAECVPPCERIVILEDVPEIRLQHGHAVYLQTVDANQGEELPSVTLESLVREALRMRPDRLIVGECRGDEAFALIQALHTGHKGSFSTLHANSPADALRRLEALVLRAEPSMSPSVVQELIRSAFDAVIFLERTSDRLRRVTGLHLIEELRG